MRERWWLLGISLLAAACGGEAEHRSSASAGADSAPGGTVSIVGGAASVAGGASGSGGGSETAGEFNEFSSNFESAQPLDGIGLWMGLGDALPIALPPVEHDGTALHLVGDSELGLDVFYHLPLPVERMASELKFSAYSREASPLTVGIAGPNATYFSDRAAGIPWPEQAFQVGPKWKSFSFSLDELNPPPPHEEMFGAIHFVVPPGEHYDFWIDDFTLVSRTR